MAPAVTRAEIHADTRAAFEALFREHWSAVHAYARRRTPDADAAHDVAAETFATAWRRVDELPAGHELPWLYRTAGYVLANRRRSDRRRARLVDRVGAEPVDPPDDPADIATDDVVLVAAFAALTADEREVLRLVAWEGLANADVALVLGCSTNAAALRVSRARARLAEAIDAQSTTAPTTTAGAGHERGGPSDDPTVRRPR